MAAIDYTVIVYKNGEYMEHPCKFDEEKELCINKIIFPTLSSIIGKTAVIGLVKCVRCFNMNGESN